MLKRLVYGLYFVSLAVWLAGSGAIYRITAAGKEDDAYQQLEIFTRVLERVRKDYVDGEKLTYQDLIQGALKGMLSTLDPHSEYMDLSKYKELKEDTEGAYGGVGLQVQPRDGNLTIIAPMEDSPAFEAGLQPGDKILQIDDLPTEKMSQTDAVKRLRGEPGTTVKLTIGRASLPQPKEFVLKRADIQVATVKDVENRREFPVGADRVGYVRLTQFGEKTADELEEALRKLEGKGMAALVMDLRGNPGGLLDQAVAICEKFLARGQPIVTTEARSSSSSMKRQAAGRGKARTLPMVILVNGGSASASEIVAGCLQDLKRAVVVGEQTFGKGSVQSILPLTDGTALRLTTAKYYTPSHKVIHEKGISPDIVVPMSDDEELAVQLRRLPGGKGAQRDALNAMDAERQAALRELVENGKDAQLERATDLLKAMNVFVKRDTPASAPAPLEVPKPLR